MLSELAALGGLKVVTGVLAVAFLSGFQQFNLDKVLMEHLYSEEIVVSSGKKERSDKEEFLQRITNRKPYSFGYFGY